MSIEAMKQALEALDTCHWDYDSEEESYKTFDEDLVNDAIEALRQAIEEAEQWDTSDMAHRSGGLSVEQEKLCKYCRGIGRVVCDGKCMPEQEPVSWAETNDLVCALLRQAHDVLACASYPFKRPWVGLTDEEIKNILDCGRGGLVDIKKAEQILREKNT
jgi:hypothetical protein